MRLATLLLLLLPTVWAAPWEGLVEWDDSQAGTAVLPFLKMPVGARAVAMGGYEGPHSPGPSALFWNPAALWRLDGYRTVLSHTEVMGEFRHEAVAGVFPIPRVGPVALGLNGLFATPFEGARDIDENDVRISASDFSLSAGWGYEVMAGALALGARGGWVRSQLDGVVGDGYTLDLGMVGRTFWGGEFSFSAHNLSHGFQYRSGTEVTEKMPALLRLGVGGVYGLERPLLWQAAYSKSNDAWQRLHTGLEWWPSPSWALRGGYDYALQDHGLSGVRGLAAGAGVRIHTLLLDYALRSEGELGLHHVFTVTVGPPPALRPTKDPVLTVREAYAEGDCAEVLRVGSPLLRAQPDQWEVLARIQECEKRLREGTEADALVIAVTANTQGQMSPVWSEARLLGGLPRRKSFFDALRRQHSRLVLLDAGRVLDTTVARASDPWMVQLYEPMGYDAVLAGPAEMRRLAPWEGAVTRLPWLRSPGVDSALHAIIAPLRQVNRQQPEVRVLGFAVDSLGRFALEAAVKAVQAAQAEADTGTVVVVMLDGNLAHAQELVSGVAGIDILVLSGMQQALERPIWLGSTLVGSPGTWGTHVLVLTARRGGTTPWAYQLQPLDALVPEDSTLLAWMEGFRLGGGAQENPGVISDEGREEFLFYRELAYGSRDIYLKEVATNYNIRLTRTPGDYRQARMAWSRRLLMYLDPGGKLWLQQLPAKDALSPLDSSLRVRRASFGAYENWIYFIAEDAQGKVDLHRMTFRGSHRENLSGGRLGIPQEFTFSDDGRFLALQAGLPSGRAIFHASYTLGRPSRVSPEGLEARDPAYEPGSRRLAFLVRNPTADSAHWDLMVWDALGDTVQQITQGRRISSFTWAGDGQLVLSFGVNVPNLHVIDLSSGQERPLNLPDADRPLQEERPRRHWVDGRAGLLYERAADGQRVLRWSQEDGRVHRNLVESPGLWFLTP